MPVQPTPASAGYAAPATGYPAPQSAAAGAAQRPANRPVLLASGGAARVSTATPEGDEDETPVAPVITKSAPPWLISLLFHIALMIIAALIVVPQMFRPQVEIEVTNVYAEELGEQLEDNMLDFASLDDVVMEDPALTMDDLPLVDDPLATPPVTEIELTPNTSMSELAPINIGMALSGREAGSKKALLAAYGGNATTEAAVELGLNWLKKNQNKDGSWSLIGPYRDGGGTENRIAATSMALLAFQGAGHTTEKGAHREVVARAWSWLLKQQAADGSFIPENISHHHHLYTNAQATIALCELYGMTENSQYREAAQKAVKFAVNAQAKEGGWRYQPQQESDTSVTGWYVMALQSAMMAGLEVPSTTLSGIHQFLDTVAADGGRRYHYRPGSHENYALSAEGLLCRQYLGWKQDDARLRDGVARLVANPINYSDQNVYYWYYATQATHHMEGDAWRKWNAVMR
ncbi:MAG: terpene cyclase/mutase family protein, partial [Planctomycetales bacterium]|nr:terpene cyclase/mutase family protein [Planctomycetales bacterium]